MNNSNLPIAPDKPWLAPMAGFSDLPFRLLCRELGCAAACTEMISAKGLVLGQASWSLLDTCPEDKPLVVQLFGAEQSYIKQAMVRLLDQGFQYFDLNAGCAVKKVTKTGAGAALLLEPARLVDLAGEMLNLAGPGRAGVKLRLGWDKDRETFLQIARELEKLPAGWITLHPRTARQSFSGQADWSRLQELQECVELSVLGSGDLFTAEQGLDCLRRTGVRGLMFARGALSQPGIFGEFKTGLQDALQAAAEETKELEPAELDIKGIALRHIELSRQYARHPRAFFKMRTVIPKYMRGMQGARELRSRIVACRDWLELEQLVQGFKI